MTTSGWQGETVEGLNGEVRAIRKENGEYRLVMASYDQDGWYCSGSLDLTPEQWDNLVKIATTLRK